MPKEFVTNNDKAFIIRALQEELRIDGRKPYDIRKLGFEFTLDDCTCTVTLGGTRVLTSVLATLEAPYPDRPNEGSIRFNVDISPTASPAIDMGWGGSKSEEAIELSRLVERGLKQSRAIDTEALCVLAGRKVWSLVVDVHVLDASGNLPDACCLSALGALMAFRKPEVTVGGASGSEVIIHPPEVKEPLPLTIHHLPVAISFGLFEDGNTLVVDPELREEAAMQGSMTVIVNPNREVCAIHKAGGVGISSNQLFRCIRLAMTKSEELIAALKTALQQHEVRRVQARVRRHAPGAAAATPTVAAAAPAAPAKAAGALSEAEQRLASELGIELDAPQDEDMADSSSEEEEAGPSPAPAPVPSKGGAQLKKVAARSTPAKPATSPAAAAKSNSNSNSKAKKASKRAPEVKYNELEEIAAVIAGAGSKGQGSGVTGVASLADAVKKKR